MAMNVIRVGSRLAAIAVPFAVIVSVSYLWGYWGEFDVDIFSYISPSEILVGSAVPLLGIGFFSLLGFLLGNVQENMKKNRNPKDSVDHEKSSDTDGERGVSEPKREAKGFRKIFAALSSVDPMLFGYAIFAILVILFGGMSRWFVIPLVGALALAFLVTLSGLGAMVGRDNVRAFMYLVFLSTFLPLQAYGFGKINALKVIEGKEFNYLSSVAGSFLEDGEGVRYLGHAGGYLFFYQSESERVFFVDESKMKYFSVSHYSDREEKVQEQ